MTNFEAKKLLNLQQSPTALTLRNHPLLNLKPRSKTTLPAQISGIIGAYILSVIIVCIIIYILALRLRNKLRIAHDTLDTEGIDSQFPEDLNAYDPSPAETKLFPQILKEREDCTGQITSNSHGFLPHNTGNSFFDKRVIDTDCEVLSRNLEEVYAHVMAQEDAKVDQTKSTKKPFFPFFLPAIHKTKADFKRKPHFRENKIYRKSIKTSSDTFARDTPQFSSLLLRLKLLKVGGKKPSPNLKISSPIAQPSIEHFTIKLDQVNGATMLSSFDPMKRHSQDNYHELLDISLPGGHGRFLEKNSTSKLPDSLKSHQSTDISNNHSTQFFTRSLPLRKYESSTQLPSPIFTPTKTTVLERVCYPNYLEAESSGLLRTAGSIPYSPYQPQSMTIPITPTLMTKEERRRQKKLKPKIPSFELVKSEAELWDGAYDLRKN